MKRTTVFPDYGDKKPRYCLCGCGLKVRTGRIYASKDCESRHRRIGHYKNIERELDEETGK